MSFPRLLPRRPDDHAPCREQGCEICASPCYDGKNAGGHFFRDETEACGCGQYDSAMDLLMEVRPR